MYIHTCVCVHISTNYLQTRTSVHTVYIYIQTHINAYIHTHTRGGENIIHHVLPHEVALASVLPRPMITLSNKSFICQKQELSILLDEKSRFTVSGRREIIPVSIAATCYMLSGQVSLLLCAGAYCVERAFIEIVLLNQSG